MIDKGAVAEIIATYQKHGWLLRRVLLSPESVTKLGDSFGDVPIKSSNFDAAWFSRPPNTGAVSWEIRYLGDLPFAMLESLDETDADFEFSLKAVENSLHEKIAAGNIRLTTAAPDSKL